MRVQQSGQSAGSRRRSHRAGRDRSGISRLCAVASALVAGVVSGQALGQVTYSLALNGSGGTQAVGGNWDTATVWSPNGNPGAVDSLVVPSTLNFGSGNGVTLSGDKAIAAVSWAPNASFRFVSSGPLTPRNLTVSGEILLDPTAATGQVAFGSVTPVGGGAIRVRNGSITFLGANALGAGNAGATNYSISKPVIFDGTSVLRTPELRIRSTAVSATPAVGAILNVNGEVNFASSTPNVAATFALQSTGASNTQVARMNLNGDLTGDIGNSAVRFLVDAGTTAVGQGLWVIGGIGTSTFSAGPGSRFIVGAPAGATSAVNADLVLGRANALGNVATVQLGDTNVASFSGANNVRLAINVGQAISQAINVVGFSGTGTQAFTILNNTSGGTTDFNGTLTVARTTTLLNVTGNVVNYNGSIALTGGATLVLSGGGRTTIVGNVTGTGLLTIGGTGTVSVTGSVLHTGNTVVSSSGSASIERPLRPVTGSLVVTGAGATVTLSPDRSASANTVALEVAGLTVSATGSKLTLPLTDRASARQAVAVTTQIAVAPGAFVDLTNNDLIVRNGDPAALRALVARWFNNGGTPVNDGLGANSALPHTSLSVLPVATTFGFPEFSAYAGVALGGGDVVLKYTWLGDVNLDGVLDARDFNAVLSGTSNGLTGWANGDVNHDGVADATDWGLFQAAYTYYGTSGVPLGGELSPGAPIPEPAAVGLVALAGPALLRRRRA